MKKIIVATGICLLSAIVFAQTKNTDLLKAEAMLKKMTLEEKVGQMTQVNITLMATNEDGDLDAAKVAEAIQKYKVGSLLNSPNHAISQQKWQEIIGKLQDEALKTRLKIPIIYGLDAIHGETYTLGATLFPQNIAMAATRNLELGRAITKVTAKEVRASGVRWNFAPVLDCGRQPLWSRFPETYGEDVYLGKTMGAAVIKAYEEDGLKNPTAVASCMKHYIAYSASRNGKDRTPIYLSEIELREYYLPQFREAIKAGASTVMINSSEINGTPVHADKYLLTDVLRKELGFEGLIVTDWEDIKRLYDRHFVAPTPRAAVAMAVNAGIDMSMVPMDYSFYDLLLEAVKKGEVPITRIDDAVKRILTLKYKLGLFDNPYTEPAAVKNFGLPEYQNLALDAAHEGLTLLKNEGNILPLAKNTKVLVAGPSAQSISALNGGWSYTWQGKDEQWFPTDSKTIYQSIADKLGAGNVTTTSVIGFDSSQNYNIEALKNAAANVDAIILCIGENAYAESPGNIPDLALDEKQVELVKAAAATGKKLVVVLTEGRPRFITNIEPKMNGILLAQWCGKKSAEAIADVLFGDYNPNGKLPFSYPRSMGELVLYDRKPTEEIREVFNDDVHTGYNPLFAFGHGLSYTSFAYGDIQLNKTTIKGDEKLTINIKVANTGSRDGKLGIDLFTHQRYASITPNMKRLRAFQKIDLKAGESKTVTFNLDKNDLAFVNAKLKTVTEAGDFDVMIGDKKATFNYQQKGQSSWILVVGN